MSEEETDVMKRLRLFGSDIEKDDLNLLLPYINWLPVKDYLKVVNTSIKDKESANKEFVEWMKKNPTPENLRSLVKALQSAGMEKLYKKLNSEEVVDKKIFNELIFKNLKHIAKVDCLDAIFYYYENKIIQDVEKKELREYLEMHDNMQGMERLIYHISRRDDWFPHFIRCLKKLKENKALKAISPLLFAAESEKSFEVALELIAVKDEAYSEDVCSTLTSIPEDNKIFFAYLQIFTSKLIMMDTKPICIELLSYEAISPKEYENICSLTDSHIIKVARFLAIVLRKEGGDYHLIKSLMVHKEMDILKSLEFDLSDDDNIIKRKLKMIKNSGHLGRDSCIDDAIDSIEMLKMENKRMENKRMEINEMRESPSQDELQIDAVRRITGQVSSQNQDPILDFKECSTILSSGTNNRSLASGSSSTGLQWSRGHIDLLDDEDMEELRNKKKQNKAEKEMSKFAPARSIVSETVLITNQLKMEDYKNLGKNPPNIQEILDIFDVNGQLIEIHPGTGKKLVEIAEDGTVIMSFVDEQTAMFIMDAYGKTFDLRIVEKEITNDYESDNDASPDKPEFEFRSYQKELAECALHGRNCIIVAPTGSGKTHVAIYIIKEHMSIQDTNKAVFIVPTVALVGQQKKQLQKYLDLRVHEMSGSSDLSLVLIVDKYDVFVMTPQILDNQLNDDQEFLQKLTLVVFDECHHANKDHPYNSIMTKYLKTRQNKPNLPLPQIVGLTASIGVGKSRNMNDAAKYVETICANLDCSTISTVTKNMKELQQYVNKPNEKTSEIGGRTDDPFERNVQIIMEKIERKMQTAPEMIHAEQELNNFRKDIKPPSERGCDPYIQWLSRIRKAVCTIHRQETRMFFITCIEFLNIYNISLMINADCRTKDAVNYIENKFRNEEYSSSSLYPEGLNQYLTLQWKDKYEELKNVIDDKRYDNPKLEFIKDMIVREYSGNRDSRCIIFCKTREMTTALVNWMKETPSLNELNPYHLVGTNAPANKSGMTSVQQEDALKYFKNGTHKIIVATSVAEEGLDVQKCNLVICYEHVTNSIARVQTRGRARQENAKYVVVGEKGRGAAEREEKNVIREDMMNAAIKTFQSLGSQERKSKIVKLQKEALIERQLAESGKKISQELKMKHQTDSDFQIRCLKCDQFAALSSDIRKIEDSHHVITDLAVRSRIEIRPHPKSKTITSSFEKTGKIHCAKCKADWGIMALYKKVPFPVIKINNFIVKHGTAQDTFKQWKNVPFSVGQLSEVDLAMAAASSFAWNSENMSSVSQSTSDNWNEMYLENPSGLSHLW